MAPHSSTLAWKLPWMEEPGRLQSMGLGRVRHDWATSLSRIGEGNGSPLQCSCLESPRDGGAWWAAVYGVAQSRTRLKRLSSSSSKRNTWSPKPPSKFTHILLSCHRVRCPPTLPPWENTAVLASGTWRFMKTLGCYPYYYQVHFYFLNKSLKQDLRVIVN